MNMSKELRIDRCQSHDLQKFLRKELQKSRWYKKANKCFISGRRDNLVMHHDDISFSTIVTDSFKATGIKYKGEYTECYSVCELILLKNEVIKRHKAYAKPITLNESVHNQLHWKYGTTASHKSLMKFKEEYNKKHKVNKKIAS